MRHLVHSPGFLPEKPYKENRFLSKQRDDIKVVIANKVSSTDSSRCCFVRTIQNSCS